MKRVALLAGLLVVAVGSGVAAQDPDWEDMGGTVVGGGSQSYPDKGFTIAFPDDWLVVEFEDPAQTGGYSLFADDGAGFNSCLMYESWPWVDGLSLGSADDAPDRLAEHVRDAAEASGTTASVIVVDLPVGRVLRVDAVKESLSVDGYNFDTVFTYFRESGWATVLSCMSRLGPPDDWLPIAESFEFLPDATEPPPTDG